MQPEARDHIDEHGGAVYLWARATGCCRGRTFLLESETEPPDRVFELVHAADGRLSAEAESVIVARDPEAGRSRSLTEAERTVLQRAIDEDETRAG